MNGASELSVLYGLIEYGENQWQQVRDDLKPELFHGSNRAIFEAIRDRYENDRPVDQFLLANDIDNPDQLQHVMLSYCGRGGLPGYIKELNDNYAAAQDALIGYDLTSGEIDRAEAIRRLLEIDMNAARSETMSVREAIGGWIEHIERQVENPDDGLMTGLADVDRIIGGLRPSDVMILAGRPAMGKTALALNIAQNQSKPVLVFSLEMSGEQIINRLISTHGVPHDHLRRPRELSDSDWSHISRAMQTINEKDILINDTGSISIQAIESIARKIHGNKPIGLIVIDYLQLVTCKSENRLQEVSEISRKIKGMAKNLGVPMVVLSQLNRKVEERANPVPKLSDLRESGQLEQDADVVAFIHRPEVYDPEDRPGIAELHVSKHRHGPIGVATLAWQGRFQRFTNLAPSYQSEAA